MACSLGLLPTVDPGCVVFVTEVWDSVVNVALHQELKTSRAATRVRDEDPSRVAGVFKILEVPEPVLNCLRNHDSATVVGSFTEDRLGEVVALTGPRRI